MLIPLKTDSPDADIQEWALVELQGRIEPMQEADLQQALQVGTLQLSKTVSVPQIALVQCDRPYHALIRLAWLADVCCRTRMRCSCKWATTS